MRVALVACALTFAAVSPVCAQVATHVAHAPAKPANGLQSGPHKCSGPYDVASDNFVGNFDTKVGTYTGNVIVTQAECKLRADKVVAEAVGGNDLNRLTADGNVVLDTASGTATGDNGIYDLQAHSVTLTGRKVVLVKGKNVMAGTVLVVDMNTGLARLTAHGLPGGRVHSSFVPRAQNSDRPAPKPGGSAVEQPPADH